MALTSIQLQALIGALREERAAVEALVQRLREEQQALVAGDADRVGGGLAAKAETLATLSRHGERRMALLRQFELPADTAGIGRRLDTDQETAAAAGEWRLLLAATREAWRMNLLNGRLISDRLQTNQNALAAITPPGRSLYGSHGRSVGGWDSRKLGAA